MGSRQIRKLLSTMAGINLVNSGEDSSKHGFVLISINHGLN
jgi:hypothetical protein